MNQSSRIHIKGLLNQLSRLFETQLLVEFLRSLKISPKDVSLQISRQTNFSVLLHFHNLRHLFYLIFIIESKMN